MTAGKATRTARRLPETRGEDAPLRFVSAASLFDGHDAAINIIRRMLQAHGAEVIHLGPQPQRRRHRSRRDPGGRATASP